MPIKFELINVVKDDLILCHTLSSFLNQQGKKAVELKKGNCLSTISTLVLPVELVAHKRYKLHFFFFIRTSFFFEGFMFLFLRPNEAFNVLRVFLI